MKIEPVILDGKFVRLEPLSMSHLKGLLEVAFEESIWKWNPSAVSNQEDLENRI